jgi:hypothetical protein
MIGGDCAHRSRRLFRDRDLTEKVGALIPTGRKLAILARLSKLLLMVAHRRYSRAVDDCHIPKQQRRDRSKARAQHRRGKTVASTPKV